MTLKEKYGHLQRTGKAVLAVNFYNYETLRAVVLAAKATGQDIILQLTESSLDYMGLKQAVSMARIESAVHGVRTWLHLDHGSSLKLAIACMEAGFDSVMIDASEQAFAENVAITKSVVRAAAYHNVCVEAELGFVAKLGQSGEGQGFTSPGDALRFVQQTGVDALAVAVGTAHGFYKQPPQLQLNLLQQIQQKTSIPLVLHGASGIPEEDLREAVQRGVRKINLATEVKHCFMQKVKADLAATDEIDLRKVFPPAINSVTALVAAKLQAINQPVTE